jgi:hypothetical protein
MNIDALLLALADLIAERVAKRLSIRGTDGAGEHGGDGIALRHQAEATKPDFFSEAELARRSGLSARTLQGWRQKGGGPPWIKVGRRVLYPRPDAETFFQGRSRT